MSTENTDNVIASALALSTEERLAVIHVLHSSLVEGSVHHGAEEPASDVPSAWKDEIARRLAEIDSGQVTTVPAEQAERMIRGDVDPTL